MPNLGGSDSTEGSEEAAGGQDNREGFCTPLVKAGQLGDHLKCLCTNASIMVKKQEELDVHADLQCYKPIGMTEPWWDTSQDWQCCAGWIQAFQERQDQKARK